MRRIRKTRQSFIQSQSQKKSLKLKFPSRRSFLILLTIYGGLICRVLLEMWFWDFDMCFHCVTKSRKKGSWFIQFLLSFFHLKTWNWKSERIAEKIKSEILSSFWIWKGQRELTNSLSVRFWLFDFPKPLRTLYI